MNATLPRTLKDSGVAAIGRIPADWDVVAARRHLRLVARAVGKRAHEYDLLSLTKQGIILRDISENKGKFPASFDTYQEVRPGDLVLCLFDIDETPRTVGLSPLSGMVTGAYSVFASSVEWYRNYLYLLLLHLDDAKGLKPYYSGLRKTIRPPEFQSIKFPVPPESEARNICRYVELETARIDALIKKKTRFIELLKEKRQALITQAVTKGLDPTVPMKDSGIEDLEAVPSHWQVRLLSGLATKVTNGYVGPTRNILVEDGVRYLQSLHIKSNRIIFGKPYYVTESWSNEHKKSILNVGDVLIVQTGDVGQVAVVPEEFAGCNCHALIIVATTADLDGAYLSWLLNSQFGQASIKRIQTGAMHPHLNCDQVKTLKIPLPPLDEQLEIVNRIDTDIGRMEVLGERTNRSIDLLKERRSALITAAVTGQIDLREDAA